MRASRKIMIVAALSALTLAYSVVAANAKPFFKPMEGTPPLASTLWTGLAFGVIGAGVAEAVIVNANANANACAAYQPVYDANGAYLGQQAVNTCQ